MPECPQCAAECPADKAFCVECGARLAVASRTIAAGSRGSPARPPEGGSQPPDVDDGTQSELTPAEGDRLERSTTMQAQTTEITDEKIRRLGGVVGSYRLIELLGEGGMGWVYLAEHVRLGRRVAMKMLRPELSATPHVVKRFFAEARAVNRILHENIVEITDFVEGTDNYFIMEMLRGSDLRSIMAEEGLLPIQRAQAIAWTGWLALG